MAILTGITTLLSQYPGEIIYFSLLVVISITSLGLGFFHLKRNAADFSKQRLYAYALITLCYCIQLCVHILSWTDMINERMYTPPLERYLSFIGVASIMYILTLQSRQYHPVAILIFLFSTTTIWLASYWFWWRIFSTSFFNQTWINYSWITVALVLLLTGLILSIQKPARDQFFSIMISSILILGYSLHFLEGNLNSDKALLPRVSLLIASSMLIVMEIFSNRERLSNMRKSNRNTKNPPTTSLVNRNVSAAELSSAWIDFFSSNSDNTKLMCITRILAYSFQSQFVYLVRLNPEKKKVFFDHGYNIIQKSTLSTFSLRCEEVPLVCNALIDWKVLEISTKNSVSSDLGIIRNFTFPNLNNCIVVPFTVQAEKNSFGYLFLNPFIHDQSITGKSLENSELLRSLKSLYDKKSESNNDNDENVRDQRLIEVLTKLQETQAENVFLSEQLETLQKQSHYKTVPTSAEMMSHKTITNGKHSDSQELYEKSDSSKPLSQIETELRLTLEEMARLQNVVAESKIKIHQLKNQIDHPPNINNENFQIIDSIVQELRQPITSIIGYIHLMQSESAGSLNIIQKKYIERVLASIERLTALLDDLINISKIQLNLLDISFEKINLVEVIDLSLRSIIGQIREKNITLRLDVPKKLPQIDADKDALKLIITRLLLNACMLSPENQFIVFKVKNESRPQAPSTGFIRIQVTDSGGGIPPEEVANVFSSQFHAGKPLLRGVGDTGIGLVITKWLVEAHSGNIWVESDFGRTTTINILIPINKHNSSTNS